MLMVSFFFPPEVSFPFGELGGGVVVSGFSLFCVAWFRRGGPPLFPEFGSFCHCRVSFFLFLHRPSPRRSFLSTCVFLTYLAGIREGVFFSFLVLPIFFPSRGVTEMRLPFLLLRGDTTPLNLPFFPAACSHRPGPLPLFFF